MHNIRILKLYILVKSEQKSDFIVLVKSFNLNKTITIPHE